MKYIFHHWKGLKLQLFQSPSPDHIFLVEEHLSRHILEEINRVGEFDSKPGTGIAFQIDVEDAVGIAHQQEKITAEVKELL